MKTILFGLWDKVSGSFCAFQSEVNGTSAIRSFLPMTRMIPMKDLQILAVADIDSDGKITIKDVAESIEWSAYELPKNQEDAVAPLKK